ncbi:MAG: Uma2 family endonuclease [Actinobacteria bacterium]|nr:Uma2 family endonuclease [Actinomycetota bacterium]
MRPAALHRGGLLRAVEVRSPSTWRYDVGTKKRVYEATGLPELWLVDTDADTVLVYRQSSPDASTFDVDLEFGAGEQRSTPLLPGLEIGSELFDRYARADGNRAATTLWQ